MAFIWTLCFVMTIDRHHARAAGSDLWVVHWSQLHSGLIIHFTLTDIRTVKDVIFVIKPHQSILLLSYLVFREIIAAFAFIALHFCLIVAAACSVLLGDISIALRVR